MSRLPGLSLLFVLFATAAALAQSPRAADPDLPARDPKGKWREMGAERPAKSCVGDLRSPFCVMETMMACLTWAGDHCRTIIAPDQPLDKFGQPRDPNELPTAEAMAAMSNPPSLVMRYRYFSAKRVRSEEDMWIRGYNTSREPREMGDVVVGMLWMECYRLPAKLSCGGLAKTQTGQDIPVEYTLRRQPDGTWRVITWNSPGG